MEKTETHKATDTKTCEFDITKEETTKELGELKKENVRLKKENREFRLVQENRRLWLFAVIKGIKKENENEKEEYTPPTVFSSNNSFGYNSLCIWGSVFTRFNY